MLRIRPNVFHRTASWSQRSNYRRSVVTCRNSLEGVDRSELPEEGISWYSCGPTVYDSSHLGHARTYVCTDIIRRILSKYFHIPVRFALGMTDVDDKIINRAADAGHKDWQGMKLFAREFENSFFEDMDALSVQRPHAVLRVTDYINDIEDFVLTLVRKGYAYETADGVWFDVKKTEDTYGHLGGVPPIEEQFLDEKSGGKTSGGLHYLGSSESFDSTWSKQFNGDEEEERKQLSADLDGGKRFVRDFALWKAAKPGEPFYDSPLLGKGRPGWHIECSAMVQAYFGPHLDVHSGGVDLKFPHHTNECAQSEAYLVAIGQKEAEISARNKGRPWCSTWLHTGHLYIDGLKMSKSLKNFISIREYLAGSYSTHPAEDFRVFCLQHKYHSSLHFSTDRIQQAGSLREKIRGFLHRAHTLLSVNADAEVREGGGGKPSKHSMELADVSANTRRGISTALADDFDTPTALQHINGLVSKAGQYAALLESGEEGRGNLGPFRESVDQVESFFAIMGLDFAPPSTRGSVGDTASDNATATATAVTDEYVAFRSKVRAAALTGVKKQYSADSGDDVGYKEILRECDRQRDEVAGRLGIKLEDGTRQTGPSWRPL